MPATEVELAYLAGIVDGEGCITGRLGITDKRRSPNLGVRFLISNTDQRLVQWVRDKWGGRIYAHKRHNARWKTAFQWEVTLGQAAPILRSILPYLLLKRRQAEIALELHSLSIPALVGRKKGVPPHNIRRRLELVSELRIRNSRGAYDASSVKVAV